MHQANLLHAQHARLVVPVAEMCASARYGADPGCALPGRPWHARNLARKVHQSTGIGGMKCRNSVRSSQTSEQWESAMNMLMAVQHILVASIDSGVMEDHDHHVLGLPSGLEGGVPARSFGIYAAYAGPVTSGVNRGTRGSPTPRSAPRRCTGPVCRGDLPRRRSGRQYGLALAVCELAPLSPTGAGPNSKV